MTNIRGIEMEDAPGGQILNSLLFCSFISIFFRCFCFIDFKYFGPDFDGFNLGG